MTSTSSAFTLTAFLVTSLVARAEDLSQVYPATLDRDASDPEPLEWVCEDRDVWALSSFEFEFKEQLSVKLRQSTLVIGRSDGNAAWAVVLPERPGKIDSPLAGDGEKIEHIWMRFHPSRIGELFPEKTVRGHGPAEARLHALRVYAHKVGDLWATRWKEAEEGESRPWFAGYRPEVPPYESIVLDMDTEGGRRRVFSVDTNAGFTRVRGSFLTDTLPDVPEVDRREVASALERVESIADELRAAGLEPEGVDWDDHVDTCRRAIARGANAFELSAAIYMMLAPMDGDFVKVRFEREFVPALLSTGPMRNVSTSGLKNILASWEETDAGLFHGRTQWGVGYVLVEDIDDAWLKSFDEVLEGFAEDWAIVLDLRYGLRATTEQVEQVAGRFVAEPTSYGVQKIWEGGTEASTDLELEPRGPWPFGGVVCVLVGPDTAGEAERLALAVEAMPRGFTVGAQTAGDGLGARWVDLTPGISLYFRTGRTVDVDGELVPLEGIVPSTLVEPERSEFTAETDPVLYKALEEIYLVPQPERRMARSGEPWPWPETTQEESAATSDG